MTSDTMHAPPPSSVPACADDEPTLKGGTSVQGISIPNLPSLPLSTQPDRVVLDYLVGEIRGLKVQFAQIQAALKARPAWVDDVMAAVTSITPSRELEAKVALHGEQISRLKEDCSGRHERDLVPLLVPRNGHTE